MKFASVFRLLSLKGSFCSGLKKQTTKSFFCTYSPQQREPMVSNNVKLRLLAPDEFMEYSSDKVLQQLFGNFIVYENFISEDEEDTLAEEAQRKLKKMRYQYDHWDNAIIGYREFEHREWSDRAEAILRRVRKVAFAENDEQMSLVHVLDLQGDGFIKAHIDSVKFCGRVISGLTLFSPCVMKLCHDSKAERTAKCLLPRRSLYVMKDKARYDYTHEVLKNEESYFKGEKVEKQRRISVICRCEP